MSLFRPLKYITNVTESKGIQIMKHWISILLNCQVVLKPYSIKIAILKTFCINPW